MDHAVEISCVLLTFTEQAPFVGPLATVLKSCVELCDRTLANKAAAEEYKERLREVAELVKTALETVTTDVKIIQPYTERLTETITVSMKFIQAHMAKGFLSKMLDNKNVESHFVDLDRRLTEVMRDLGIAVSLAQYSIAARTYKFFDAQAFVKASGGPAAVQRDEEKQKELARHLECSIDDLRDEVMDCLQRIADDVKKLDQDMIEGFEEIKRLLKSPDTVEAAKIDVSRLSIDRTHVLGEGGFGVVYRGKYDGNDVAVKTLKSQLDNKMTRELQQEVKVLFILSKNPSFVRLFGANLEPGKGQLCVVLELADGSLDDLIYKQEKFGVDLTIVTKASIGVDITRAMAALQGLDIIFRDLKPQNVLIFFEGRENRIVAKLTDFGLARGVADKTTTSSGGNAKGTIPYMAPELFQTTLSSVPYSFASDVYALGITLNELMMEQRPFQDFTGNEYSLIDRIKNGQTPVLFRSSPSDLPALRSIEEIVKSCVACNPFSRPSVSAVVDDLKQVCLAVLDFAKKGISSSAVTTAIPLKSIASIPPPTMLADLCVEDVAHLLHVLEMPDECSAIVREHKISGNILSMAENVKDLRDCGLEEKVLRNLHAKSLLEKVVLFQTSGVPLKHLQAIEERKKKEKEEEKRDREEKERLEKERLEKGRLEKERLEKERLEKERLEKERLEKERLEKERLEKERLKKERLEKERLEKERLEREAKEKRRKHVIISSAKDPSKCLHLHDGFTRNGTGIHLWAVLPNYHPHHLNQEWIVDFDKNEILSAKDPSKGLHLERTTDNGAKVHLWQQIEGDLNQKWFFEANRTGSYLLLCAKDEAKCLQLESDANNGSKVHLWSRLAANDWHHLNQEWILTDV